MNKKYEHQSTAGEPAAMTYEEAFDQDVAAMTVAEFIRWNRRFTEEEAREYIAAAKAKVDRLKRKRASAGVFDDRTTLSAAGTPEDLVEQMRQAVERGQADIASRTPEQQLEHEKRLLAALLAGSGEKQS